MTYPLSMPAVYSHRGTEVAIVLLAAGESARFGTPKQLLRYKDRSLIRYLTEIAIASKGTRTLVVLGAESARLRSEVIDLPVTIVENTHWAEGISSSVRAGVAALPETVNAALIMLCDQPLVSTELLDSIVEAYVSSGKSIVACEYAGTLGAPALFDRLLFSELLKLTGDKGAKQVIAMSQLDICRVSFPGGSTDLDTTADYHRILS